MIDVAIVGGGAAGVFAALAAKAAQPGARVLIIERSSRLLAKVGLSGGGRCNLTNSCFPLSAFVQNYPRGSNELQGPLYRFGPKETVEWFESRGVRLKTEADGRIFPSSNSSETIISCLCSELAAHNVEIRFNTRILSIARTDGHSHIMIDGMHPLSARSVILATGSDPSGYGFVTALGHTLTPPIPALFALAILSSPLSHVRGISVDPVEVSLVGTRRAQRGSILITHYGFSGPAILKLSSWNARYLHEQEYKVELSINWLPEETEETLFQRMVEWKNASPHSCLGTHPLFALPKGLWRAIVGEESPYSHQPASAISHRHLREVAQKLHDSRYQIQGASPHREEFVTCGGVKLKEICWKTMESAICPGLFFAGEIVDVDGLTGGFNLQNAWTTGWIAGSSSSKRSYPPPQ
jgi:predicted Rossmann fold flavoprotein